LRLLRCLKALFEDAGTMPRDGQVYVEAIQLADQTLSGFLANEFALHEGVHDMRAIGRVKDLSQLVVVGAPILDTGDHPMCVGGLGQQLAG